MINDLDKGGYEPPLNTDPTPDPICCIAISESILLIGRESGTINEYSVPNVALRNRHSLTNPPYKIAINSNSTRAAVIDSTGLLQAIDLVDSRELSAGSMRIGRIERKDVWTMCWAKDNPQLLGEHTHIGSYLSPIAISLLRFECKRTVEGQRFFL